LTASSVKDTQFRTLVPGLALGRFETFLTGWLLGALIMRSTDPGTASFQIMKVKPLYVCT